MSDDSESRTNTASSTTALDLAPAPVHPAVNSYSLRELHWMAKAVAKAVTMPKTLQEHPEDVLAVMLAGRELGIGPMQATRQIHIIEGQTVLAAELKLALARRAGHDIRPLARGARMVRVACVTHDSHPVEWALTSEDATGPEAVIASEIMVAKWSGERGNRVKGEAHLVDKDNWQSWGFAMLWARACAQLCREHCPEAVGGMYSAEELGVGGEES